MPIDIEESILSAGGAAITLQLFALHQRSLQICDVEGIFLRGDELKRDIGRIFVAQPLEGIDDLDPEQLLEAVKAVYGLADAPLA